MEGGGTRWSGGRGGDLNSNPIVVDLVVVVVVVVVDSAGKTVLDRVFLLQRTHRDGSPPGHDARHDHPQVERPCGCIGADHAGPETDEGYDGEGQCDLE